MATAIYKDSHSFMDSTRYGSNRYDGYTFELYTKEKMPYSIMKASGTSAKMEKVIYGCSMRI